MRRKLAKIATWAVTLGLLAWLFARTPFSQVLAAMHRAAPWTVPVGLALFACIYLCDSFAIWKTFGWFLAKLSYRQILLVRGATYLLAAINYNVGQGAIVYFIHRATGAPVLRGVATVLLIMGINMLALLMLASGGLAFVPDSPRSLYAIVAAAYAGLTVYIIAVAVRPRWLANRPIFDVLLAAGLRGHLRALLVRLPHIAALIAYQWLMQRAFGVAIPFAQAVVCLPVVLFIAVLPISVQGLGTTQAAAVFFFARFAPGDSATQEATVLTASLFTQVLGLVCQVALGVLCLRSSAGRDLRSASAEAASAEAAATFDAGAPGR